MEQDSLMKAKALLDSQGKQACTFLRQVLKTRRISSAAKGSPDVQISCSATRVIYGWYENYGPLLNFTASRLAVPAAALSVCVSEPQRDQIATTVCASRATLSLPTVLFQSKLCSPCNVWLRCLPTLHHSKTGLQCVFAKLPRLAKRS